MKQMTRKSNHCGLPEPAEFWQNHRRRKRQLHQTMRGVFVFATKPQPQSEPITRTIGKIQGSVIIEQDDGSVTFAAGATIDGDGASGQFGGPPCYAPASYSGQTLDILANAGSPGNWYGVVTDNSGTPIIQGPNDPCPGAYVSATSLRLLDENGNLLSASSPFAYVDSATVPFIVVPPLIIGGVAGIVMGCRCVVTNTVNGQSVVAVVADGGPRNHLGESVWRARRRPVFAPARSTRQMAAAPHRRGSSTNCFPASRRS
jgi:hypothetical protein